MKTGDSGLEERDIAKRVQSRTPVTRGRLWGAAIFFGLFLVCAAMSWRSGLFRSEFGRYPDEANHYMIGLCTQDFLLSGHWSHPVEFVKNYYLHFPKLSIGQWPPGFTVMQVAWGLVFGISRVSMLWGMVVLTAWLCWVVFRAAERHFGVAAGLLAAIVAMAAPITQAHTAMVMAEIPLAAASFLAIEALVRYLDSDSRKDALWFAFWTSAAVMIKGNGWVIVMATPVIIAATGKWIVLVRKWFWIAAVLIGVVCVPYTLLTMRITSQGWDTRTFPGWYYEWLSLGIHTGFVANVLGWPLTVLAVFGAVYQIVRTRSRFWIGMTVFAVTIILFHTAIPTSIEPRKIYQVAPVMAVLAIAGVDALADVFARWFGKRSTLRLAFGAAAAVVFFTGTFFLLPEFNPGFAPVAEELIRRPDTRNAAVLVSSNPVFEDCEAALIAEWASRERTSGVFIVRGTKLLTHTEVQNGQINYIPNYQTEEAVEATLRAVPISYIVLHTTSAIKSYGHHDLLRNAIHHDAAEWERIDDRKWHAPGATQEHEIEVYKFRKSLVGVPVHFNVDLTNKVGYQIGVQ